MTDPITAPVGFKVDLDAPNDRYTLTEESPESGDPFVFNVSGRLLRLEGGWKPAAAAAWRKATKLDFPGWPAATKDAEPEDDDPTEPAENTVPLRKSTYDEAMHHMAATMANAQLKMLQSQNELLGARNQITSLEQAIKNGDQMLIDIATTYQEFGEDHSKTQLTAIRSIIEDKT